MIAVKGNYARKFSVDGKPIYFYAQEGYHTKQEAEKRARVIRDDYGNLVRVVKMSPGRYFLYIAY